MGEVIKDCLLEKGESYPTELYNEYAEWCEKNNYHIPKKQTLRRTIQFLKDLNLIKYDHEEPSSFGKPKRFYRVNKEKLDSKKWKNPEKYWKKQK